MKKQIDGRFEIRRNEDGSLDEIVACQPRFFHLEQMNDGHWWLALETRDGHSIRVDLSSKKSVTAMVEEDGVLEDHNCVLCPKNRKST